MIFFFLLVGSLHDMLSYGTCRFQLQGTGQLLLACYYSLGKLTQLRWSSLKSVSTVSLAAFTFAHTTLSFLASIPSITKGACLIIGLDCPTCIWEESSEQSNVLDFWQLRESQWLSCSLHNLGTQVSHPHWKTQYLSHSHMDLILLTALNTFYVFTFTATQT